MGVYTITMITMRSAWRIRKATIDDDFATQQVKAVDDVRCSSIISIKMTVDVHSNDIRVCVGGV